MSKMFTPLNGTELAAFFLAQVSGLIGDRTAFSETVAHFGPSFRAKVQWQNIQEDRLRELIFESGDWITDGAVSGVDFNKALRATMEKAIANHPDLGVSQSHIEPKYTIVLTVRSKAVRIKAKQPLKAVEEPMVDAKGERLVPQEHVYTDQGTITYPDKVRENLGLEMPPTGYSEAEMKMAR